MYGTVEQVDDGRWQLRFVRTLHHPRSKVWRAVTEPEHLARWFPTTIDGERTAGAALRFTFPGGEAEAFDGEMLVYEPEAALEFRWGPDVIRIELRDAGDATELTLLDTIEERGKAARDGAGWHACLDALGAALAGEGAPRERMEGWKDVRAHYVESFGPEASTIGPPEGIE